MIPSNHTILITQSSDVHHVLPVLIGFFVRLLQMEEKRFKLTNAFTTVDSRSPLKISEEYRHMQQHVRAAAARAHRKLYKNCNPVPFHDHTMVS